MGRIRHRKESNSQMFEIYKPSGRFGLMALPLAVLVIVGAVAAAYVYQLGLEMDSR